MPEPARTEPVAPPPQQNYPHHRECVKCGYDLFGQHLDGVCPECGSKVADTASLPLWQATHPRHLARTRRGLRLLAMSFITLLGVVLAMTVAAVLGSDGTSTSAMVVALVMGVTAALAGIALLTGLTLLGLGVGQPTWRRWLPLPLAILLVSWGIVGDNLFDRGDMMLFGSAIGVSLVWLFGLSIQLCVASVTPGLALRRADIRARRFLKVTRLMLFLPPALVWSAAIAYMYAAEVVWFFLIAVLYVVYGAVIDILFWMLLAAIHWLRLLRFMEPPRTLPS